MTHQSKDSVQVKKCKKCGVEQPMTEFYMSCGYKDGYMGQCILCLKGKTRAQMDERRRLAEKNTVQRRACWSHKTKVCYDCGVDKSFTDFKVVFKNGPYGPYYSAIGRCSQCEKDFAEFLTKHPRTVVTGTSGLRFLVAQGYNTTAENAFFQLQRSKQNK
jgi:hypothetical protein